MYTNEELTNTEPSVEHLGVQKVVPTTHGKAKKTFVEPDISVPVDVLEATTFFQGITSGVTLP